MASCGLRRRAAWSLDDRMTSRVACHHSPWMANTIERRQAWHAIIAFGQHKRSNDVERGLPSSPLGSTHGPTTSGVACHHRPWTANTVDTVERSMPSTPRDNTHRRTMLGVSCYHHLSVAQTVRRRWAWHAITALGQHTWSDDVGRGMPSPPLDSTHGRTTSGVA